MGLSKLIPGKEFSEASKMGFIYLLECGKNVVLIVGKSASLFTIVESSLIVGKRQSEKPPKLSLLRALIKSAVSVPFPP